MRLLCIVISATEGKKQSGVTSVAQVIGTSEEVTFELRSEWQEGVGLCKPCRLSFTAGNLVGGAESSRGNGLADSEAALGRHRIRAFSSLAFSSLQTVLPLTAWLSAF